MFKLRLAILGAAAALAVGTASAMAMQAGVGGSSHGATVSSAARTTCRASEIRGQCVSAIASTEGQENNKGQRAAAVAACKNDPAEDAAEKPVAKHDMAAAAADRAEDRKEQQAVVACITGNSNTAGAGTSAQSDNDAETGS